MLVKLKHNGIGCVNMLEKDLIPDDEEIEYIGWDIQSMLWNSNSDTPLLMPDGRWWPPDGLCDGSFEERYGIEPL